jgi:hypothetical protein
MLGESCLSFAFVCALSLLLSFASFPVISLEHNVDGEQRTGDEPGSSSPAMRPALLLGLSFPSLSHEQSAQLLRHVRSVVVTAASSSLSLAATEPLPADLFAQLFYSGCAQCAAALLPDSNGVLECTACLVGSRASQPPPESEPRLQWMYRDALLHLASANAAAVDDSGGDGGGDGADSASPPAPPLVLASHATLIDLLGHIDPATLRAPTRAMSALHQQSQHQAVGTQISAAEPASSAPDGPSPPSMSELLRVQWCRLLLTLLYRDDIANEGPASPPPLIHFALEESAMAMAHRDEDGTMTTSAAAPPRLRPPAAAAALPLLASIDMWRV